MIRPAQLRVIAFDFTLAGTPPRMIMTLILYVGTGAGMAYDEIGIGHRLFGDAVKNLAGRRGIGICRQVFKSNNCHHALPLFKITLYPSGHLEH